jgi:ABC-type tungstate transport system permease subunit
VEEQRRREEQDKLAAITKLEARSKEIAVEKEEKRKLEEKITSMQSQLLIGGHKITDMPVFRQLIETEQKKIRNGETGAPFF